MKTKLILFVALLTVSGNAMAASFIVPTDDEMVLKSAAITVGTVEGFTVQEADGLIETVYEIRAERALKGGVSKDELLRVVALGGVVAQRGLLVPGEARFAQGERVLVFLNRDRQGRWRTTDLTLGRFQFVTSTKGERLLVRDTEDVVGWDHAGRVHHERVRREDGFLRFVEERTRNRPAVNDYTIDASEVTLAPAPDRFTVATNATSYPASTYTDFVSNQPIRWPNIAAGVLFYKRSTQNIAGAADGGVSVIQGGLAAWNNEPGSNINLIYNGQVATASANHDGTNVVEFNDPQGRISGSWSGSGTVGICFISFSGSHTFLGQSWLNITGADVVFQDGYPATNASFRSAMTHELGHGIGWRHSNQNHVTGGACNSAAEECTSAAIMNSSVSANYGHVLQPWDVNAAQSVYPGGPTCTAPSISAQPASRSITSGTSTALSVTANGTAPLSYQWYIGASGNTASPISGATGFSVTVAPTSTTTYWVRVSSSCGTANSASATVTVTSAPPPPPSPAGVRGDINGDGKVDILWRNYQTGENQVWYMDGTTRIGSASIQGVGDYAWRLAAADDFNRDGHTDLAWYNVNSGQVYLWLMNRAVLASSVFVGTQSDLRWSLDASGDLTKDGNPDLVFRNRVTGENSLWVMNGTTRSSIVALQQLDPNWKLEGAYDMNGDGLTDLVWRHTQSGTNTAWNMNGSVLVSVTTLQGLSDLNWLLEGVNDYDGDGDGDLIWRNNSSGANRIWLMAGAQIQNVADLLTVGVTQGWEIAGPR